ncbi:MAG: hypothetical protein ACXVFN_11315 [Solirubrobacteraceae bacterium]
MSGAASAASVASGAGRPGPVPERVWREVEDAGRLARDMAARGRQVRFAVPPAGGVEASLVDEHLGFQRPLLLLDAVDAASVARLALGTDDRRPSNKRPGA